MAFDQTLESGRTYGIRWNDGETFRGSYSQDNCCSGSNGEVVLRCDNMLVHIPKRGIAEVYNDGGAVLWSDDSTQSAV